MRDDFSQATKEVLAKRVGYHCSNPKCHASTSGPQEDPIKTINVGVAAHITAASPDGPRYNDGLTEDERKSPENGIWLCQKCAKLIDNDTTRYTVEKLKLWKQETETIAVRELEGSFDNRAQTKPTICDEQNRPAFQILPGAVSRLETEFQPSWGIKQVSGDYVTNMEWRFRGPRFPMEWRSTTGYALENTHITCTFNLAAEPVHDDLIDINEIAVEIRFQWQGRWLSEIHRWPITHNPKPTKSLWDVGREKFPPICIA
ncbi:MAG: hypothetical protein GY845_21505 [Planctomycetes bacterium]|nr:hypothetical protein [Planctomycetota bacterium]